MVAKTHTIIGEHQHNWQIKFDSNKKMCKLETLENVADLFDDVTLSNVS